MPLSEDEQRILQDIERSFYESDPAFAKAVTDNKFNHAPRNARFAALGFVVSLLVLAFTFASLPLVGLIGFLGMVTSAVFFVQNVRRAIKLQSIEDYKAQLRKRFDNFEK